MARETVVPELGEAEIERDLVFGHGGDRELRLDLYHPPVALHPGPAILMIHGGGWRQGAKDMPGMVAFGTLLSGAGYLCAAIEYRLSGEATWPAQLHDARSALRWLRANASALGIDPGRVAVLGKSAGAHIALVMAATVDGPDGGEGSGSQASSPPIAAVAAFYPPTQLQRAGMAESEAVRALMGASHSPAALAAASPLELARDAIVPPTLLLHGALDRVVSPADSRDLYSMLSARRLPVELHLYAGLAHGFDNGNPGLQRQCADIIVQFLGRFMGGRV